MQGPPESQNQGNHEYWRVTNDHTDVIKEGINGTFRGSFNVRISTQPLYGLLL